MPISKRPVPLDTVSDESAGPLSLRADAACPGRRDVLRSGSATVTGAVLSSLGLSACGGSGDDGAQQAVSNEVGHRTAQAVGADSELSKIYDSNGLVVGVVGNPTESQSVRGADGVYSQITRARFTQNAPMVPRVATIADCGAFWYQDFGLEHTRYLSQTMQYPSDWLGWYDWRWNHTSNIQNYQADRHPMLGWYRGDDSGVLAWQVKWLVEHGVKFVICQQRTALPDDSGQWGRSENLAHWIFQLMNSVPNIGSSGLQVAFWLPYADHARKNPGDPKVAFAPSKGYWEYATPYLQGDTVIHGDSQMQYCAVRSSIGQMPDPSQNTADWKLRPLPTEWKDLADFYLMPQNQPKHYCVTHKASRYPLIYVHEGENCRSAWGTGAMTQWLKDLAQYVNKQSAGAWAGVSILMRKSPPPSKLFGNVYPGGVLDYDDLEASGVLLLRGDYDGLATSAGATGSYEQIINHVGVFEPGNNGGSGLPRRVFTAVTSLQSVQPHPSPYQLAGHSPENFKILLGKIVPYLTNGEAFPLLMINNVSEWAESGPGLQPNKKDGFGYLQALKDVLTTKR